MRGVQNGLEISGVGIIRSTWRTHTRPETGLPTPSPLSDQSELQTFRIFLRISHLRPPTSSSIEVEGCN